MYIGPATERDVPALLPMVRAICRVHRQWDVDRYDYDEDPGLRYAPWLRQRAADPRSVLLIARQDDPSGQAAAFLVATVEQEIPVYRLKEYGFIHDLWVEPFARRQGIARQMMAQAIAAFDRLGVKQVRLSTAAPNEVARKLFASCGFRPTTVDMLRRLSPE